ncbi:MAG: RNA-binding S4 domain-containing protein [Bacteroidetes bacterium]|nr:RNA-binding S4 domain-containing protein [Fibrella sp.]
MKEDDFNSGDRRDGGRPTNGRRDDARSTPNGSPRPRRDDQAGGSAPRDISTDRRTDSRPTGDAPRRYDNTGSRPFNREGGADRRSDDRRDGVSPRPPFDRDRNAGNAASRPERPSRPGAPRFGNGGYPSRPQTERREEYPKPKFDRDSDYRPRWETNKESNERPRFSDRRDGDTKGAERRDGAPSAPRFDRDADRRTTGPPDGRPADRAPRDNRTDDRDRGNGPDNRRDERPRNNESGREERPRTTDDSRQRSGENRFGQERRYEERPRPARPADAREGNAYNRDDDRRTSGPRDERSDRRPSSRDESPRPTRPYDNDRPRSNDRDERPRSFDRDRSSGPTDRRDERPRSDDRNDRPERPTRRFDTPTTGSDRPRPYSTPSERPTGDRRTDRDERPAPRRDDRRSGPSSEERRVGRYDRAPNYDQNAMRNGIPRKKREELERAEKHDNRNTEPGTIRLNRYIANAGICSRREADELIAQGTVQVNGKVVTEMGHKVQPGDVVKYGSRILNPEKMVYLLLNKPKDYITTTEDPEERRTVMELVADAGPFRIYPVGRLDRNTTGLMLMTNDGELAEKLTHPSNEIKKVYQVELDKPITDEHFEAIQKGIELEDGLIKPDGLSIITPDAQVIGIEIHSGRNRIVRRIFENFGYEVTKLDRTSYAGLTKKELPRGKWRFLEPKEVVKLKYLQ